MSGGALDEKVKKRNEKIDHIYRKCYSYMCYCVSKYITNRQDIEDTVHDAMVKLLDVADSIDTADSDRLMYFCGTVARNKAIDRLRGGSEDSFELSDRYDAPHYAESSPEESVLEYEAVAHLVCEIERLDVRVRDVCILRFSEGYKEREIAEALGISIKTVHSRISRGRKLLSASLEKKGEGI